MRTVDDNVESDLLESQKAQTSRRLQTTNPLISLLLFGSPRSAR